MLINVNESVVSFMNKDIIDISIGSVNPDSFSLKRLPEYSVNSPVVYDLSYYLSMPSFLSNLRLFELYHCSMYLNYVDNVDVCLSVSL